MTIKLLAFLDRAKQHVILETLSAVGGRLSMWVVPDIWLVLNIIELPQDVAFVRIK